MDGLAFGVIQVGAHLPIERDELRLKRLGTLPKV
jgi:hypothetical protein